MPVLPLVASSRPRVVSEEAAALRVGDDGGGGAVFYGAARIGPFGFAEDLDTGEMGRQLFEAHERRVSDTFEDRCSERFDGSDHAAFAFVLRLVRRLRLIAPW